MTLVAREPSRPSAAMGPTPLPLLALALLSIYPIVNAEHQFDLCDLPYCHCFAAQHPRWNVVNCTIPADQKLDIMAGHIPQNTSDLIIKGGDAVMFGANSLSHLKDPRQIYVSRTKILLWRKNAGYRLNILNFYVDVQYCDVVRFEKQAFHEITGPLSVRINDCDYVSTEGDSFSWLLQMKIIDVKTVQLGQRAFALEPSAANIGEHGPGMTIMIKNVVLQDVPMQTFGSSAAEIRLENVVINTVHAGAFSANTYNIVIAINCSIQNINEDAFAQRSLINSLSFIACNISRLSSRALQSAVEDLHISRTIFENISTGAINTTVATAVIENTTFIQFMERGIELSSWTLLSLKGNSFDELTSNAFVVLDTINHEQSAHRLVIRENEIETAHPGSLKFIGQAEAHPAYDVLYHSNYYGQACNCNVTRWLAKVLETDLEDPYLLESHCIVDEFFARCFNLSEPNMILDKFFKGVCKSSNSIRCESFKSKSDGSTTEIKNPRFPHKNKQEQGISDRDKKVIGIVIVTCLGCVIIVLFISFIRWMRRKGYCVNFKNFLIRSNSSCGSFCDRLCSCGMSNGIDNARSISRLSVNEYSERHRLNEPTRIQEMVQETILQNENIATEDKTTQTLPEELTKELLDNLKGKLENPENYAEAREMVEHLYVLIKLEESNNSKTRRLTDVHENIYELPFQDTNPRIGRNKKQMISIGTRTPSLDKLLPLSPYNRQTALVHEYFEPKDFAALAEYAEIINNDKEKRTLLGYIPDVVAEQAMPRGPYLRAVHDKKVAIPSSSKSFNNAIGQPKGMTVKSTSSNSSGKMMNRPLPEKPVTVDPCEGTSFRYA